MKQNMIYLVLLSFFLSPFSFLFSDYTITRGPDIGEIYYIGPTVTGEGIYRSTDFGETATCVDSTSNFQFITADLTSGVVYATDLPNNLYISHNYGQEGSWIYRNSYMYSMHRGRSEGNVYNRISKHSEDYGVTFIEHSYNGYLGTFNSSEIDNEDGVGYALVYDWDIADSLFLLISYDNFENLEIQNSLDLLCGSPGHNQITRGYYSGELYMDRVDSQEGIFISELWYSDDYGENWSFRNYLLGSAIVGGHQPGELYVLRGYIDEMGTIKHKFIHHSLDYGETFTSYHTFNYGSDPNYTYFEALPTEGTAPLTVQFIDLSSGEYLSEWEWNFNNDGIIDSYEQNPEYTYQDTGFYSVKLRTYHDPDYHGYIKRNYIHVTNGSEICNEKLPVADYKLSNYPNPFNPSTTISFDLTANDAKNAKIEIYNLKGQKVKTLPVSPSQSHTVSVVWNGTDDNGKDVSSGVYFYKLKAGNCEKSKKMLLLR
ncbi:MAG TPA: FlgD immunoglobulin-like domain containing protein [Candidatus Cloacimonadota bacterium]|nr:FlgD immunoglobulin-like domain containing protein [Candidatus Cloacimonadota bacterium]